MFTFQARKGENKNAMSKFKTQKAIHEELLQWCEGHKNETTFPYTFNEPPTNYVWVGSKSRNRLVLIRNGFSKKIAFIDIYRLFEK